MVWRANVPDAKGHPVLRRILTATLVAIAACGTAALADPRPAKLMTVTPAQTGLERAFFGRVKARQTIDLAFQVGGQILSLPVDEGQSIAEGDLLAELDLEPFELSLARAETELEQAQADFDRLSSLGGTAASQVSIDNAETALELARIARQDAQRALRQATLTAPFDGIVARRMVPNFTTISAGTPVVRLHDMSDLRIEIEVPEVLFQQAGRNPDVRFQAQFPTSDRRFDLAFREVTAETTPVGQAFRLTLGMDPPETPFLLPGASATVYARINDAAAPLVVPAGAVIFDPDGAASVMLFEADADNPDTGTVRRQPVTLAPSPQGRVAVTEGLAPGDEIVAAGAARLADGDAVTRFAGF